jgi:exodeoxyribonuclease V alpha subunit
MLVDKNKTFKLFAPTGRASKVLAEYTNKPASTIHRGLGYIPPNEWIYNKDFKLDCDVLIVDEFSMTDIFIARRIFDALDLTKTKLLIIGDNAQLPSVAAGNLLHDIMSSKIIPTTTLTNVFRYGKGGLMTVATDVRNCKKYLDDNDQRNIIFFGDNKDYAFINSKTDNIVNNTVELYKKLLDQGYKPEDIQVLTAYNKGDCGSVVLNNHLQKVANKNYGSDCIKIGDINYFVGDLVIQKVNNYKAKIYIDSTWGEDEQQTFIANGEMGVILEIGKHYIIIDFDGVKIIYSRDEARDIKLGYSISIHSSQGGSSKIIILLTPNPIPLC